MTNKGKGLQLGGARCPESGPFPVVNEASFPFPDRMALNGVLLMEARGHLRGRVWFESVTRTETGCLRNSGRLRGRVRFFREKPMERATVHVLVVDDIEQWRDAACTMVHSDPRFFVVGVASDGAEAVRKAKALRPNIVLLDMNLPDLHGIEVARIIAEVFATLENHLLNARSHQRFDRRRLPRWGKRICSQIERGPGPYACAQRAFL